MVLFLFSIPICSLLVYRIRLPVGNWSAILLRIMWNLPQGYLAEENSEMLIYSLLTYHGLGVLLRDIVSRVSSLPHLFTKSKVHTSDNNVLLESQVFAVRILETRTGRWRYKSNYPHHFHGSVSRMTEFFLHWICRPSTVQPSSSTLLDVGLRPALLSWELQGYWTLHL